MANPIVPIDPSELVPNLLYRITHRANLLPPRVAYFVRLLPTDPGNNTRHAMFKGTKSQGRQNALNTTTVLRNDEWIFSKSGLSLQTEKILTEKDPGAIIGLGTNIQEILEGRKIGKTFGTGRSRQKRKNRKTQKNRKRRS